MPILIFCVVCLSIVLLYMAYSYEAKREGRAKKTVENASQNTVDRSSPFSKPYIVVDVETTGLNPETDQIIQLSAIRFTEGGNLDSTFNSYLNPGCHIPSRATEINGITDRLVADAPTAEQIQEEFLVFSESRLIVGYNTTFDLGFLYQTFGEAFRKREYVDVLPIARTFFDLPNYKLGTVAHTVGFRPAGGFHDALTDCKAVAAILKRLDWPLSSWVRNFYGGPSEAEKKEQRDWEQWMALGQSVFLRGEEARKNGKLAEALALYDQAKSYCGVAYPFLYESYAMVYYKQKDYENEVRVLDEGIARFGVEQCPSLVERREKAVKRQIAQAKAKQETEERQRRKEERTERKIKAQEEAKSRPKNQTSRPVVKLDDDGTVLEEFPSVAAAEKAVGVSSKSIRSAASGKQKHAGGFCWKYADVEINAEP